MSIVMLKLISEMKTIGNMSTKEYVPLTQFEDEVDESFIIYMLSTFVRVLDFWTGNFNLLALPGGYMKE